MAFRPASTNPLRMAHDALQLLSEIRDLLRETRDARQAAAPKRLCASCDALLLDGVVHHGSGCQSVGKVAVCTTCGQAHGCRPDCPTLRRPR